MSHSLLQNLWIFLPITLLTFFLLGGRGWHTAALAWLVLWIAARPRPRRQRPAEIDQAPDLGVPGNPSEYQPLPGPAQVITAPAQPQPAESLSEYDFVPPLAPAPVPPPTVRDSGWVLVAAAAQVRVTIGSWIYAVGG